jgi:uncharacterized protein involved in exopolysaccharide biosynthesis
MSADPQRRRPATDVEDEEQEVDLGRYVRAVTARWWLLLVGLVIGAAIGFAVSAGGGRPYEATAVIYFGQPFAPGLGEINNLATQVAQSEELVGTVRERTAVAKQVGIPRSRLVNAISITPVSVFKRKGTGVATPLAEITATNLPRSVARRVADIYARRLVHYFSSYPRVKLAQYDRRLERIARELKKVNARIDGATRQQAVILAQKGLPPAEKFLLLANVNTTLLTNQNRQNNLESQQIALLDNIALAKQVESASLIESATVSRQPAPSRRTGAAVGGFIGLIIGALVALLWDPVERRFRKTPAQQPA